MTIEDISVLLLSVDSEKKKNSLSSWLSFLFDKNIYSKKTVPSFIYTLPLHNTSSPITFLKNGSFLGSVTLDKKDVVFLEFLFKNVHIQKSSKCGRVTIEASTPKAEDLISTFSGLERLPEYLQTLSNVSFYISSGSGKNHFYFPIFESLIVTGKKIELSLSLDSSLLYLCSNQISPLFPLGSEVTTFDVSSEAIFPLKYLNSLSSIEFQGGLALPDILKKFGMSPPPSVVTSLLREMVTPPSTSQPSLISKFNLSYNHKKGVFLPSSSEFSHILPPFVDKSKIFNFLGLDDRDTSSWVKSQDIPEKNDSAMDNIEMPKQVFGIPVPSLEKSNNNAVEKQEKTVLVSSEPSPDDLELFLTMDEFLSILKQLGISKSQGLKQLPHLKKYYRRYLALLKNKEAVKRWLYRGLLRRKKKFSEKQKNILIDHYYLLYSEHKKIIFLLSLDKEEEEENMFLFIEKMKRKNLEDYYIYPLLGIEISKFFNPETGTSEFFYHWTSYQSEINCINKNISRLPNMTREDEEIFYLDPLQEDSLIDEPMSIFTLPSIGSIRE